MEVQDSHIVTTKIKVGLISDDFVAEPEFK
jgi:hypothetical protein